MTMGFDTRFDAIVVGSGMGGMSCAAALARCGKRVLVLEQHYVAGGFTHTFSRKGYTWDVGVHCLGEMEANRVPGKLVSWLSDGKIHMQSMGRTYDTFFFPDQFKFELPDSHDQFRRNLVAAFPNEVPAIDAYIQAVRDAGRAAKPHFMMRVMPSWAERLADPVMNRGKHWWQRTTAEVLREITPNKKLQAVLAGQWGYYGSVPSRSSFAIHAITVRHFWNGGFYPSGGSSVFAEHFLGAVKEAGGEVRLRASVDEVIVRGSKAIGVRLKGGEEIFAPIVISAAGARATVERLLPEEQRERPWAREIRDLKQSPAHLCLNLGFEGDIAAAGATVSNQWFFETWDMEWAEWDLRDPNSIAPVLYVSYPTLKDPEHDAGPTQKHTGEVVTFVPWGAFEKWKGTRRGFRDKEYMEFKKQIEERLTAQLRRHIPKLMDLVKYQELATPLSTVHFTRAPEGAIYGLEPTPQRFACKGLRTRTPVKGLYLAGADVATLGVVGALMGGVMAAGTIDPRVLAQLRK
jgi:all-trans-retinol 13,14-reductase